MSRQAASAQPAQSAPAAPARLPAASAMAMSVATALGTEEQHTQAPPQPLPLPVAKARPDEPPPVDFSRVANRGPEIIDADTERARITRLLLNELAPALGLDLSRLRITVDAAGGARIDARGASGLQEDSHLLLHPSRYRPESTEGRYLLAHEAVHAAQRQLPSPAESDARFQIAAAEAEAGELGRDFAARRSLRRPRIALRRPEALADTGDAEIKEAPPALVDSVKDSRSREIAMIHDALDGWWVSDGDVFTVMRVLDSLDFEVAKAVLQALENPDERYWLADNINPPHVYQHRRSVLVAYAALDEKKFDAIDLKVLRALPMSGMSPQETESAVRTVRCLSAGDIESLLASEKGDAIAQLIGSPALDPKRKEEIRLANLKLAEDEAALATRRRKILALGKDDEVQAVVEAVRKQLSVPDDAHGQPRHPHGGDAIAVVELLDRHSGDQDRFLAIAELLESEGLVDALLELMPAGKFFDPDHPEYSRTLIGLVRSRLPIKNEQMIEDLLSYGVFDWAIRDYEAHFAYELIRLMPMSAQYRFRQRDGGKWYLRLLDNLPDAGSRPGLEIHKAETAEERDRMVAAGATRDPAAGDEDLYYNASAMYEARLKDKGVRAELDTLVADFEKADEGIFRDHEAIELYHKVVALGGASLEPGKEDAGDAIKREAIVRELDRHGLIACLFDQLPDDFLFAEENRISTVKIMLSRDSMHVQQHARDLVSYGLFDWMVWDSEAYLAYLCIKALPGEEREAFVEANAELWSRIQAEMSVSMRHKRDTNLYIGDKEGTDRASVLAQLADGKLWNAENSTTLDSLLRMAVAMTEHRFAFERSREFAAVDDEALKPLVAKYRLWDPASGRDVYSPEILKGTRWHEEGIFASLKSLWGGLVTLWNMDVLFIDGKIGARVDLNDAQDFMGGDLMGARLADPAKAGSRQEPVSKDANKLTLLLDPAWLDGEGAGKSAELILPQLLIESTNVQTANTTIQTGEVDLRNLHIRAAYDGQNTGQAAQAHVTLDSLIVNDLLLARSGAMYTITRLVVETLRLAAGSIDSSTGAPAGMRTGRYIPFPLLALAMLPWLAQIAVTQLIAMPIRRLGKLPDQGLEPQSRFAPDMLSRTKAIDVSFSKLSAEGFSTSGGQHVAHAAVEDFTLRVGLNKATRLRAELASLDDRLKALDDSPGNDEVRTRLQARRATLLASQKEVEAQEQRYLAIQQQIRAGGLDGVRQRELQQELDNLDFEDTGAAFLDVGRVEASGISGTVTARDRIELKDVHGEGGSSALLGMVSGPTATPAELARRANEGVQAPPLFSKDRSGALSLELGDVSTGHLEVGGGVRGVKQIEQELEDLGDIAERPELAPLADSLRLLLDKARRYEAMVAYGVSALDPKQLDEFRELRRVLTADAAVIVESIKLTRARLDVDLATGRVDIGMDKAHIAGLKLPQQGISVEEVNATGVRFGALPANGLLDWRDWRKHLQDADAGIDSLVIRNARSKYHGLLFEKVTVTGAHAAAKARGNDITLGLKQLDVEGIGLAPRLGLLNRRLSGLRQKARLSEGEQKLALEKEIGELSTRVDSLQALADSRLAAYVRLEQAKTPEEVEAAEKALHEVDAMIILDFQQNGAASARLEEFGVNVSGAGDLLSDALGGGIDPLSVLERGVKVTGTGDGQQLFKKLSVHGLQTTGEDGKGHFSADAGAFDIEGARLGLSAKKNGDEIVVTVPKFEVDAVGISQFLMTSLDAIDAADPDAPPAGIQIWSRGASRIETITYSGKVTLASRVPGSRDLSDYRLKHVRADSFEIGKLTGDGLGFSMPAKKLEVDILSGSISGLHATGIDVEFPEDKNGSTTITGKIDLDSIDQLVVGQAVMDTWSADGTIDAQTISVGLLKDGGITATIGELDLVDFGVRGPDGWVRLNLSNLAADVGYKDGTVQLNDIRFDTLQVKGIHWKVGDTGFVESDKTSTLSGLRLKGRLETVQKDAIDKKTGKPNGEKERSLSKVHVESLGIDRIESDGLVYQDEDNRVELKAADASDKLHKHMGGFKPLFLQDVKVWDLDWVAGGKGVTGGHVGIGEYAASAHYKDLKSSMIAGLGISGKGMSAEIVGPGQYTVDLGKADKSGGYYADGKLSSSFGTGAIIGKMGMGPDYVEASDIEIDNLRLDDPIYEDAPKVLKFTGAGVEKIKLKKFRQNYALSTGPDKKPVKTKTDVVVEGLELIGLYADGLDYDSGEVTGFDASCQKTTSRQKVTSTKVTVDYLHVERFTRNAATGAGEVTASIDVRPGGDPKTTHPFAMQGAVADLQSSVAGVSHNKLLKGNIEGGPLSGKGFKFATVTLGTRADGTPITRTQLDGTFTLSRLGVMKPEFDLGDGLTVTGPDGSIEFAGDLRFLPNDSMMVKNGELAANKLKIKKGGTDVDVEMAKIKGLTLGLKGLSTGQLFDAFGAHADELELKGIKLTYEVDRSAPSTPSAPGSGPVPPWILEPLGGMHGTLDVQARGTPVGDVNIPARISGGVIDFDNLTGDDGKFLPGDIWFFADTRSFWARHYKIPKTLYESKDPIPGVTPAEIEYVPDYSGQSGPTEVILTRGQLNLRQFMEGTLNKPASGGPGAPPEQLSDLNTLGIGGSLALDDGVIAQGANGVTLHGKGSGKNKVNISGVSIGSNLTVDIPDFEASKSNFEMLGQKGETGQITATVSLSVVGLGGAANSSGHFTFQLLLEVEKGVVKDIRFGDMDFIDEAKLGAKPAPTAEQIEAAQKGPACGGGK